MDGIRTAARAALALACAASIGFAASPATALPQSLRSDEDLRDVAEAFLSAMVANEIAEAYRSVGRYWSEGGSELAAQIAGAETERKRLRATIGLSLGWERVRRDEAAKRVVRLVYLERFDEGAVVWQLVFYRADASWQLVSLESSQDLGLLFDGR